jgi:hypothetical protein
MRLIPSIKGAGRDIKDPIQPQEISGNLTILKIVNEAKAQNINMLL